MVSCIVIQDFFKMQVIFTTIKINYGDMWNNVFPEMLTVLSLVTI